MDEEQESAQKLTKDDLLAKLERGRPTTLQRPGEFSALQWPAETRTISVDRPSFGPEIHGILVAAAEGVTVS